MAIHGNINILYSVWEYHNTLSKKNKVKYIQGMDALQINSGIWFV